MPWSPATTAVVAGRPEAPGSPLNGPVVLASAYRAGGEHVYARDGNPSWALLEQAVGALEGGTAVTFSSGLAAVAGVLGTVAPGGRVVLPSSCYFGVSDQAATLVEAGRLRVSAVDVADTDAVVAELPGADLLWVETPTNPLIDVADLPALVAAAVAAGVPVAVDNTFATPMLTNPLHLGATWVVHSASKAIGGHGDLLLGVAVGRDAEAVGPLVRHRHDFGSVPGALEAFLALRGVRTLPVRVERAQRTAQGLAERLCEHPAVATVRYPGLPDHPGHRRAAAQMRGFGSLLSFETVGDAAVADRVCREVRLITHATSLGGVDTLMERRARYRAEADRGTPPTLLRLSVGLEDLEDLWADLDAALSRGLTPAG